VPPVNFPPERNFPRGTQEEFPPVNYPVLEHSKHLANANRPCDCSLLCLRPKSSLCNCPHSICRRDVIRQRCGSMDVDATTG